MAGSASISGLISGLKTDDIIAKMLEYGKQPITILQNKQAVQNAKLTAWQDINTRLLALKMKAGSISSPINFSAKSVTSSDSDILSAVVTPDAAAGSYTITVNCLAQAEQKQSQGYADLDKTIIGTGKVTVGVGSAAKEITIDNTNNTLSGLRDAINRADAGVTASIIDLGSLTTHDYHLSLTSKSTGEANTVTWTPELSGGTAPTWTTTVKAQDASITFGEGETATTFKKSSNSINDVLPGVYMTLSSADATKPIKLTVSPDTSAVKQRIKDFITQYNSVISAINSQFQYDPETQTSGTLFGDYALQNVQEDIRRNVLGTIPGLPATMSTLSQIGITSDTSDQLVLDETALDSALASDPNGVMKLFAESTEASDYSISVTGTSSATQATGSGDPYKVRIDRLATQARVTAGVAQTANLTADETLTINGKEIKLTSGMSADDVVSEINKYSSSTGMTATRTAADGTGTGNYLTLTRNAYGAAQTVKVVSSVSNGGATPVAGTSGFGNQEVTEKVFWGEGGTGTGAAGQDVAGAFGVTENGVTTWEEATGVGQTLSAKSGNEHTDGLKIKVTSSSVGEHGTIKITQGVTKSLDTLLGSLTDSSGSVMIAQDTLTKQIADLKDEITSKNKWLSDYEERLRTQFAELEDNLGKLQNQNQYLSAQFASMNSGK